MRADKKINEQVEAWKKQRSQALQDLKNNPEMFAWGQVVKIHEFENVGIVEYIDNRNNENVSKYHVYVDGADTSRSSFSFDGALLIAISRRCIKNVNDADHMMFAAAKLFDLR